MSYILEALKKADRDRHPVAVPTLATVHRTPQPSERRVLWPWIAGAVIVANAVVWMWLLRPPPSIPEGTQASGARAPTTASAPAAPDQVAPASPAELAPAPALSDKTVAVEAPSRSVSPPTSGVSSVPLPRRERQAGVPRGAETKPTAPVPAKPLAPSVDPQKLARADARTRSTTGQPARVTSAGAAASTTVSPSKPAPAPGTSAAPRMASTPAKPVERGTASVPTSKESPVPQDVFANMHLQVLVYSEVPSQRLVFINNQKYVEGQRIDANLVIESITPDSAVLSYQGKRVLLRSDQPASR